MMKKSILIIGFLVCLILIVANYSVVFAEYSGVKDCVPDEKTALQIAFAVCKAVYPKFNPENYYIRVKYDSEEELWDIRFVLNIPQTSGGGPIIQIRKKNAEVVYLIHGK